MARNTQSLTKFLQDLVDNSKDLVDDLIDRAAEAESGLRAEVSKVAGGSGEPEDPGDLERLQTSLADLSAKVDTLARARRPPTEPS